MIKTIFKEKMSGSRDSQNHGPIAYLVLYRNELICKPKYCLRWLYALFYDFTFILFIYIGPENNFLTAKLDA